MRNFVAVVLHLKLFVQFYLIFEFSWKNPQKNYKNHGKTNYFNFSFSGFAITAIKTVSKITWKMFTHNIILISGNKGTNVA